MDINDAGRIGLGTAMGAEILQIQGRLLAKESDSYLMSVSTVRLVRGGEQIWRGERVLVKPEYVGTTYERRFSRGRTIVLSAVVVATITAVALSTDLLSLGIFTDRRQPGDSLPSFRSPRP